MNPKENNTLARLLKLGKKIDWVECPSCFEQVSRLGEKGLCMDCESKEVAMKDWKSGLTELPEVPKDDKSNAFPDIPDTEIIEPPEDL